MAMALDMDKFRPWLTATLGGVAQMTRISRKSPSANFHVRDAAGRDMLVKVLRAGKPGVRDVDHPLATRRVRADASFDGHTVSFLSWKSGRMKRLADMTPAECDDLVRVHADFVRALGDGMIHGDFNWRNVLFERGRVSAILDYEDVKPGDPVADFVRFAATSLFHLPIFSVCRRRATLRRFAGICRAAGWPHARVAAAVDAYAAHKMRKCSTGLNAAWHRKWYGRLKECVHD